MHDDLSKGPKREKNLKYSDYITEGYFQREQWDSFRFQAYSVYKLIGENGSVYEIGKGNGFVGAILQTIGIDYVSVDINANLMPTYVADISDINMQGFKERDCVLCSEVLEHIPFNLFGVCIENLYKLSGKYVVLSLPDITVHGEMASMHFWEVNSSDETNIEKINQIINRFFNINDCGMIPNNQYHRYWILEKGSNSL